jgi:hypothetical protein
MSSVASGGLRNYDRVMAKEQWSSAPTRSDVYGLAYVLIPRIFHSLQAELDQSLAPFKRGGEDVFPRSSLAFDDATDALLRLHRSAFRYESGRLTWREADVHRSLDLSLGRLSEHLAACGLDDFGGTFAELEPDFDAFVRRFTTCGERDATTLRYGRWLNPIGYWDWWELGGRFNGALTGERRPAASEQTISSGANSGRALLRNVAAALGAQDANAQAEIELNVELVESLRRTAERREDHRLPMAVVLPVGSCPDKYRWFDALSWHEIQPGTRTALHASRDADFAALVRAAYDTFSGHAVAGVAYHF